MTSRFVLDDDDRVALIDEFVQHFEQLGDIVEVQARGRLVEYVERLAGGFAGQFLGELDALGFAAGERGGPAGRCGCSRGRLA